MPLLGVVKYLLAETKGAPSQKYLRMLRGKHSDARPPARDGHNLISKLVIPCSRLRDSKESIPSLQAGSCG